MARYTYLHPDAIQDQSITKAKLADGVIPSISGVNLGETDFTSDITLTEDQIAAFKDPDTVVYLVVPKTTVDYRIYLDVFSLNSSGEVSLRHGLNTYADNCISYISAYLNNGILQITESKIFNISTDEINKICV